MPTPLAANLLAFTTMTIRVASLLTTLALLASLVLACSSDAPRSQQLTLPSEATESKGETGYLIARGPELHDVTLGGESRLVLRFDDNSAVFEPVLSEDGKRIAFIRQEPVKNLPAGGIDFGSDLYIVNRDGTGLRELAHHSQLAEYIRRPSWVDNERLVFGVRGRDAEGFGDYRIEQLDLEKDSRSRVIADAVDPAITPDFGRLLTISVDTVDSRETVQISGLDGSTPLALIPAAANLTLIGSAVMSPDGSTIAFAAGDLTGALAAPGSRLRAQAHPYFQDVWLMNADGSNLRRVAELVEQYLSLAWAPDGGLIYALGAKGFHTVNPATGEVRLIGDGAPQGGGIFFYSTK